MIYKLLAAGAIAAAIGLGGYFYGKSEVTAMWEADKAVWQANYDKQVAETKRVEAERDTISRRVENELQPALESATAAGTDLAGKLRDYQARARRCAVSQAAGSPAVAEPAGGEPADIEGVDEALGLHLAACARDAERLTAWQNFYQSLRDAQ